MHKLATSALAVGVAAILGACGGSTTGPITAELKDFTITLGRATTATGATQFTVHNGGAVVHEFVVLDTDTAAASLPVVGEGIDESAPGMTVVDEIEDIAVGATQTLDVSLAAGHYAIICNVPGHYAAGMHADLTVQ